MPQEKAERHTGLFIVDYLQLITTGHREENRTQEVSKITRAIKTLAMELETPILVLAQLSREVARREDKEPSLSDLRDSGTIEADADTVIFLYQKDEEQELTQVKIAKNRNGPTGFAELYFLKEYTKFVSKGEKI